MLLQNLQHVVAFAQARRRAATQQDRALGKNKGGIFDKHQIRIVLERRQNFDVQSRGAQGRGISGMFRQKFFVVRRCRPIEAQAVDDAPARPAQDGAVEIKHAQGRAPFDSADRRSEPRPPGLANEPRSGRDL